METNHKTTKFWEKEKTGEFFLRIQGKEEVLTLPHHSEMKIQDVKQILVEKLSLESLSQISLIHGGKILENDDMTLIKYEIRKQTTIWMLLAVKKIHTQIFVRPSNGESLYFLYEPHQKIGELKAKIESSIDVPMRRQILFFEDVCLYDDMKTLEEYRISAGHTLDVEAKPADIVRFWIQTSPAKRLPIEISLNEKVKKVKKLLKKELGVSKTKQSLVYEKLELKSEHFLKQYNIKDDSIVNFYKLFKLNIVVEDEENTTLRIKTHALETIRGLKEKIHEKYDVKKPKYQTLSDSKEKVLKDHKTLSDYKLNKKSVLYLSIC